MFLGLWAQRKPIFVRGKKNVGSFLNIALMGVSYDVCLLFIQLCDITTCRDYVALSQNAWTCAQDANKQVNFAETDHNLDAGPRAFTRIAAMT
jgi:hypothetical protein